MYGYDWQDWTLPAYRTVVTKKLHKNESIYNYKILWRLRKKLYTYISIPTYWFSIYKMTKEEQRIIGFHLPCKFELFVLAVDVR